MNGNITLWKKAVNSWMMLHNLIVYYVNDNLFWFISFGLGYPFPNIRMSLFFLAHN